MAASNIRIRRTSGDELSPDELLRMFDKFVQEHRIGLICDYTLRTILRYCKERDLSMVIDLAKQAMIEGTAQVIVGELEAENLTIQEIHRRCREMIRRREPLR